MVVTPTCLQWSALPAMDLEIYHVLQALVVGGIQEHLRPNLTTCECDTVCIQ